MIVNGVRGIGALADVVGQLRELADQLERAEHGDVEWDRRAELADKPFMSWDAHKPRKRMLVGETFTLRIHYPGGKR